MNRLDKNAELWIDALRGIAALMVMLTHSFELAVTEVFGWDPHQTPGVWRFARVSLGNGDSWVWLFFVISGLCIHRSIAAAIDAGHFRWRKYILARITRIYPLFLLGLLLAIAAWSMHLDFGTEAHDPSPWPQLISSLFNLQLLSATFPAFSPSWSLTCEVMYYAAWPLALILFKGRVSQAIGLALGCTVAALLLILFLWKGLHRFETSALVNGLWTVAVLFPVWISGAWLGARWQEMRVHVTKRKWLAAIGLCVVVMVLEWILRYKDYPVWDRHFTAWGAAFGLVCVLAGAHHTQLSGHPKREAVCRWLGVFSYPCYILHIPVLLMVNAGGDALFADFSKKYPSLLTAVEILGVLLILAFIGPRVEKVTMNWRSKFLASA